MLRQRVSGREIDGGLGPLNAGPGSEEAPEAHAGRSPSPCVRPTVISGASKRRR